MDPEGSDSDVSATGCVYHTASPAAIPAKVPLANARLESSEAIDGCLTELSCVEDRNFAKIERLEADWRRTDEKIARKRDVQDRKIMAIMDLRQRRDTRIAALRVREDADFKRVDEELEEEEMSLRRRLKRLKRGLPPDESPQVAGCSISTASASPPGPAYSTIPPPAKYRQSNPPSQTGSPLQTHPGTLPSQPTAPLPSYSFYQPGQKPYAVPYHSSPAYSTVPPPSPHAQAPPPILSQAPAPANRSPFNANGHPASPLARPPQNSKGPPRSPVSSTPLTAPPPRQKSSPYDTRPPPPPFELRLCHNQRATTKRRNHNDQHALGGNISKLQQPTGALRGRRC